MTDWKYKFARVDDGRVYVAKYLVERVEGRRSPKVTLYILSRDNDWTEKHEKEVISDECLFELQDNRLPSPTTMMMGIDAGD